MHTYIICNIAITCYRNTHTFRSLAAFLPTLLRKLALKRGLPGCFMGKDLYKAACFVIRLYFCFSLRARSLLLVTFGRTMSPCSLETNSLYLCNMASKSTESCFRISLSSILYDKHSISFKLIRIACLWFRTSLVLEHYIKVNTQIKLCIKCFFVC